MIQTYTVHTFDPKRPALYVGQLASVEAGNITGARNQVAKSTGGNVQGDIISLPNGLNAEVISTTRRKGCF